MHQSRREAPNSALSSDKAGSPNHRGGRRRPPRARETLRGRRVGVTRCAGPRDQPRARLGAGAVSPRRRRERKIRIPWSQFRSNSGSSSVSGAYPGLQILVSPLAVREEHAAITQGAADVFWLVLSNGAAKFDQLFDSGVARKACERPPSRAARRLVAVAHAEPSKRAKSGFIS